jgi:hypothetical protein
MSNDHMGKPRIPNITLEASAADRLRNAFALARLARQGAAGLHGLEVAAPDGARGRVERALQATDADIALDVRWPDGRKERLIVEIGTDFPPERVPYRCTQCGICWWGALPGHRCPGCGSLATRLNYEGQVASTAMVPLVGTE